MRQDIGVEVSNVHMHPEQCDDADTDALALGIEDEVTRPGGAGSLTGARHGRVAYPGMDSRPGHLASERLETQWARHRQSPQRLSASTDYLMRSIYMCQGPKRTLITRCLHTPAP